MNALVATRVRTAGIPGPTGAQAEKVRLGNALADTAAVFLEVQHKAMNLHQLEQPGRSMVVKYSPVGKALEATGSKGFQRDACVDGAPW